MTYCFLHRFSHYSKEYTPSLTALLLEDECLRSRRWAIVTWLCAVSNQFQSQLASIISYLTMFFCDFVVNRSTGHEEGSCPRNGKICKGLPVQIQNAYERAGEGTRTRHCEWYPKPET
jgi:hypothetical protein